MPPKCGPWARGLTDPCIGENGGVKVTGYTGSRDRRWQREGTPQSLLPPHICQLGAQTHSRLGPHAWARIRAEGLVIPQDWGSRMNHDTLQPLPLYPLGVTPSSQLLGRRCTAGPRHLDGAGITTRTIPASSSCHASHRLVGPPRRPGLASPRTEQLRAFSKGPPAAPVPSLLPRS